jgi:hypothetical protein
MSPLIDRKLYDIHIIFIPVTALFTTILGTNPGINYTLHKKQYLLLQDLTHQQLNFMFHLKLLYHSELQ